MPHLPLTAFFRPHPSSDRRTPPSGQPRSRGHCPRCHRLSQQPWHHFPCHPLLSCPRLSRQWYHHHTSVMPLVAGARCPITTWPLCKCTRSATRQARGHPTSSTTQVHRVTARKTPKRPSPTSSLVGEPSKLHPFIASCVMAFDSWPCKFATDHQRVSYAVLYLSDIAMMWWQLILVTFPE